MPITHEQKASLGAWFLAEIDRRIELRQAAKAQCVKQPEDGIVWLGLCGNDLLHAKIKISDRKPTKAEHHGYAGGYFTVHFGGMLEIDHIPQSMCPRMLSVIKANEAADKRKVILCTELEFLHGIKTGSQVGSFQAYVSRLWAPKAKTETLSESAIMGYFDAFCDSRRGFSCPL